MRFLEVPVAELYSQEKMLIEAIEREPMLFKIFDDRTQICERAVERERWALKFVPDQ